MPVRQRRFKMQRRGNMKQNVKQVEQYKLGEQIGKGAFGTVYKALDVQTGDTVAIKSISMKNIPDHDAEVIMMEIDGDMVTW